MYGQTHPLRGRLRLRFSDLKNNLTQLTSVIESLRTVNGVGPVEGSPLTGGILVHYDTATADTRRFWNDIEAVLRSNGLHHNPRPLGRQTRPAPTPRSALVASSVAGRLVDKRADKPGERSANALEAAVH